MDKLRILYVNHTGNVSGAEILIIRVTDELNPQHFEKIGMCPFDGKLHERFAEAMDHVELLPMQSTTAGFYSRFKQYLSSMVAVYRAILKHRIHLVHANSFRAALIAAPVGLLLGKPVIWHMYDILQPKLKNILVVRLYSHLVKKIVAVSNATRDALLRVGAPKSKIKRIYNCLDREKILHKAYSDQQLLVNPAGNGPKIVMSGQITPWKGQDVLLNAIPTICSIYPKAHFFFIGESHLPADKEFQEQLKEQAQAVGIDKKITWMGFRRDGLALLKQADIIVHCSVYPDPLPTVVMEGMALERMVIASDIGGVPEMVI
ncbi:MAG TPA: glycosyltransferase, partial [bacterium]|nr:glycosyltransferase [bacterium]